MKRRKQETPAGLPPVGACDPDLGKTGQQTGSSFRQTGCILAGSLLLPFH